MNHSQRLREKPLLPWVICEVNGKILASHCNCMAGMGESCSHIASLLWAIEAGTRLRDSLTVTQKKAYWVLPPGIKDVPYAPISDITFQGKGAMLSAWKALSAPSPSPGCSLSPEDSSPSQPSTKKVIKPPTPEELDGFFLSLSQTKSKPAILSLIRGHSSRYIPNALQSNFPEPLSLLFKSDLLNANYSELLEASAGVHIQVTPDQCLGVEENTRGQSKSSLWFQMRAGRVTASRLKSVCCTDPAQPSLSLIISICHPEMSRFKTAATVYGCEHEAQARNRYSAMFSPSHDSFEVKTCGLFLSASHPFIAASPDGIVKCLCCGEGVCEIKVL